jgi:hypothetical protein
VTHNWLYRRVIGETDFTLDGLCRVADALGVPPEKSFSPSPVRPGRNTRRVAEVDPELESLSVAHDLQSYVGLVDQRQQPEALVKATVRTWSMESGVFTKLIVCYAQTLSAAAANA